MEEEFFSVENWVWVNPPESEEDFEFDDDFWEWEEADELPSHEDVLEWQGKGWLWE